VGLRQREEKARVLIPQRKRKATERKWGKREKEEGRDLSPAGKKEKKNKKGEVETWERERERESEWVLNEREKI
jgi:hypothetical protein